MLKPWTQLAQDIRVNHHDAQYLRRTISGRVMVPPDMLDSMFRTMIIMADALARREETR